MAWWEAEQAGLILNCHGPERSTWLAFTDAEREALATHDYVALFELGRAQLPDADPVHRAVRAGLRRAAGLPARVRGAAEPLERAVPRHLDLSYR